MEHNTHALGTKSKANIKTDTKYKDSFMQNNNSLIQHDDQSDYDGQQVLNIPKHAYRWLKQPAPDEEDDPLSALVRTKQKAESLRWASPVDDGPSMGSIQASSQLLQEHVVLLNLEDHETSDISVVAPEIWPHHSESDKLGLSASDGYFENGHCKSDLRKGSAPYKPGDAIQRLSPIFDEPSDMENVSLNDSSPEQVVPNHVLKDNKSNHEISCSSGFLHERPKDFHINGHDAWRPSKSVPDFNAHMEDKLTDLSPLSTNSKEKDPTGARSESYYDLCFLTSDIDTDNPDSSDDIINGVDTHVCGIQDFDSSPPSSVVPISNSVNDTHLLSACDDETISCQPRLALSDSPLMLTSCHGAVGGIRCRVLSTTESESSTESNVPLIEQLPEELIFKMLLYLSKQDLCLSIAPVSHKWRSYAYDPILWQFIDLSQLKHLDSLHLCNLLRRSTLLKSLNLPGYHELNFMEVKLLSNHCPMLQELNLGFCKSLKEYVIQTIASKCKALTTVNVEGCEMVDNGVAYHFTCLPELRVLNLSHCTKVTDEAIINIAVLCEKLEALNIDGIPWISDIAIRCLATERRDTLEAVFLDGAELTDDSFHNLTECSKLHTLSISFCELFTDKSLTYLKKLSTPKHLRLKRGVELTEPALADLFLADTMASLTYLNLTECSEISDLGVANLAKMCRSLQHLALCWCWDITDVGLEAIIDNCGCLEVLDLLGLKQIEGKCLDRVPEALPYLKFLDLRQCNMIQDAILVALVATKEKLRILNYYGIEVKVGRSVDEMIALNEDITIHFEHYS